MNLYLLLPLIALSALGLAKVPAVAQLGLSALPLAIVLGIAAGHLLRRTPSAGEEAFSRFSQQKLLRLGIILFGFGLNFHQLVAVGWQALVIDAIVVATIFLVGTWVGIRLLKLEPDLAMLTSVGSAICGAAAIMAAESVIKPKQRDITVAVATVVLFGTLAMFSHPYIYHALNLSQGQYGIYIGSTIHEVAQAVAAGQSVGGEALQNAVIVKLIRVMMLAPFIMLLSAYLSRRQGEQDGQRARITIPWFVLGFILAAGVNTWVAMPASVHDGLGIASQLTLAMAMAALGLHTRWQTLKAAGVKPLLLAAGLFVLLMVGGYGLNRLLIG